MLKKMRNVFTAVLGILLFSIQPIGLAQVAEKPDDFLKPEFHQAKREQLRRVMPPNSVAVFFSNAVRSRSNDGFYQYHPDPNFYYLTGYQEPDAILLIRSEEHTSELQSLAYLVCRLLLE